MSDERARAEALIADGLTDVDLAIAPGRSWEGLTKVVAAGVLALFELADAVRATDPDAPQEEA